jgi:tRNA(Ile2) C34 agmatinyltransferase TiaS
VSAIFKVPCPECGQSLSVADRGLECPDCRRSYQSRMGHLLPMAERASATIAVPAGRPATPARS